MLGPGAAAPPAAAAPPPADPPPSPWAMWRAGALLLASALLWLVPAGALRGGGGAGGGGALSPPLRLAPLPSAEDVAVLYFGVPGWTSALEAWSGLAPHTHAARYALPSHQRHIYGNNRAAGWTVQPFFHTWDLNLAPELAALYRPLAFAAGTGLDAAGVNRSGGRFGIGELNSIEQGLLLVAKWERTARGGLPFHRVLVTRFDSYWGAPFEFSRLADDDVLYLASFCNAVGEAVEAGALPPQAHECRRLADSPMNDHGVGDMYFAGSSAVLRSVFVGLVSDKEAGVYGWGGFWAPHGPIFERLRHLQTPTRRYLLTHYSVEIMRMALECGIDGPPDGLDGAYGLALDAANVYNQCGAGDAGQAELLQEPLPRVVGPGAQGSNNVCSSGVMVCTCSEGARERAYAKEACNILHDFHFRGGLTEIALRRRCDLPGGGSCKPIG
jgi:hypothetical protein